MQTEKNEIFLMEPDQPRGEIPESYPHMSGGLTALERWRKGCTCKGWSSMPGYKHEEKIGEMGVQRIEILLYPGPMCLRCGKPWIKESYQREGS